MGECRWGHSARIGAWLTSLCLSHRCSLHFHELFETRNHCGFEQLLHDSERGSQSLQVFVLVKALVLIRTLRQALSELHERLNPLLRVLHQQGPLADLSEKHRRYLLDDCKRSIEHALALGCPLRQ